LVEARVATFTHTDSQYGTFNDANLGIIGSTNLLDVNATWAGAFGSSLDVTFFMTNVTGEKY
jgi:hypothetical protein